MFQTLTTRLSIVAMLALVAMPASAIVVTRSYVINSAALADIYSATFDGALIPCNVGTPPDAQECTFFNGYLPAGRNITFSSTGTGTGTLNVTIETSTGEILQVNEMLINMPDMTLDITHTNPNSPFNTETAHIIVVNNNGIPGAGDNTFVEAGTGTLGRDLDNAGFFTLLGQGTADPDQAPALGQPAVFQHQDPGNSPDAPDFAVFNDIVDSCTPGGTPPFSICGTIFGYLITLDAIKYRLEGTVSGQSSANSSLVLKSQTGNFSIYRVNLTVALDTDNDGTPDALDTDDDNDGIADTTDNCTLVANNDAGNVPHTAAIPKSQFDADGDQYGNFCDGDLNQSGQTTTGDYTILRNVLSKFDDASTCLADGFSPGGVLPCTFAPRADMNASGQVTTVDYTLLRNRLSTGPAGLGPSGFHPPLP